MKKLIRQAILLGLATFSACAAELDASAVPAADDVSANTEGLYIAPDTTHSATLLRSLRGATVRNASGAYVRDTHIVLRLDGTMSSVFKMYYVPGTPRSVLSTYFTWTQQGYVPNLPEGSVLLHSAAYSAAGPAEVAFNGGGVDFSRGHLLVFAGSMSETNLTNNTVAMAIPASYDFRDAFVSANKTRTGYVTRTLRVTNFGMNATPAGCVVKTMASNISASGVRYTITRANTLQSLAVGASVDVSVGYNTGYYDSNGTYKFSDGGATAYVECPYFGGRDFPTTAEYTREIIPGTTAASPRY